MTTSSTATVTRAVDLVPEIIWDDTTTLRPGVDFHDGTVYFTVPAKVNVEVTEGRGRNATTKLVPTDMLVCVTSDGRSFPYTKENVERLGFAYPEHVTIERTRRWSRDSITEFLAGNTATPNPAALHRAIRAVYEEYIEFAAPQYYDILPLFVMGTYLFRLFKSLGYLHFNGTAASGKSQNLRILDALAFNAVWASSMSAAALYRQVAGMPGTTILDEAEGWEGERGEELRRILNAGYLDGSTVRRAEKGKNDAFQVVSFESYGPKAIASINPLDNVIGSRCLVVGMRPALRTITEFNKDDPRWSKLRDKLYIWTLDHAASIAAHVRRWNEELRYDRAPALLGRQWQITQLYIVLADYIDGFDDGTRANELITFFNTYFADLQRAQDATDRIRIVLKALPRVLYRQAPLDGGFFYLKTIHEIVSEYIEEDAKEYYKTRNLAKHLDVLGFKNKRSFKQGMQIWLDPDSVRNEFRQRRVEPHPEDAAWLAGDVDYVHAIATPASKPQDDAVSFWADQAEDT